MTENAIKLMRHALASKWRFWRSCWHWRGLITELVDAYEKSVAKTHAAGQDKFMAEIAGQEIQRQELDKSASESFNAMTQPLEENNHVSN